MHHNNMIYKHLLDLFLVFKMYLDDLFIYLFFNCIIINPR